MYYSLLLPLSLSLFLPLSLFLSLSQTHNLECPVLKWLRRALLDATTSLHPSIGHSIFPIGLCNRWCRSKLSFRANTSLHTLQTKPESSWVSLCLVKSHFWTNVISHWSHLWFFSLVWVLSWRRSEFLNLNAAEHSAQLNGFSSVGFKVQLFLNLGQPQTGSLLVHIILWVCV